MPFGAVAVWQTGYGHLGRDLPETTKDFKTFGLDYPQLYKELIIEGTDFSRLSMKDQQKLISGAIQDSSLAEKYCNKLQLNFLSLKTDPDFVTRNKRKIKDNYSLKAYGQKLSHFYESAFWMHKTFVI